MHAHSPPSSQNSHIQLSNKAAKIIVFEMSSQNLFTDFIQINDLNRLPILGPIDHSTTIWITTHFINLVDKF